MPVYSFEGRKPVISKTAYIAPSAQIIGDVIIGQYCYIGHGAILRGDYGTIIVGDGSAIEEAVMIHARPDDKTDIGKNVTVGHRAMIHNATIKDNAIIGMSATISDYSVVGEWAIIGEMGLVKNSQEIPDNKIAIGVPAKVIGDVKEDHKIMWGFAKELYNDLAKRYPEGQKEISLESVLTD